MQSRVILDKNFYLQPDVVKIARHLLGKVLVTCFDGNRTSGIIFETEAYAGISDRASHAYGGKVTKRNEVMYREGGLAYVYLCYGIHSLFNVVTNVKGIPHAVLVRGIWPFEGLQTQSSRLNGKPLNAEAGIGPGKVSKLLGLHYSHSGISLTEDPLTNHKAVIWIEDWGRIAAGNIIVTKRIGVAYAGADALLPYRFVLDIKKAPESPELFFECCDV
ncbi:MAG: DNA-3-methyladenine glycosylase [Sphingobacteriia bacterium]|nr:DNA-3-methyladenine glycosylase [Sphingobacteriia bacterium]